MIEQLAAMSKYEAYKDSGVEWLEEIPKPWTVKRLKYLLDEINDRSETGQEELLSLSKYKGVIKKSSLGEKSGEAASLVGYKKVATEQLVINKMQAVNGLLAVSSLNGITSPDYSVYKEKSNSQLNIYYLNYLLNQPELLAEFKKRVTGVMEGFIRLYTDDLYDIKVIMPPLPEQTAIAAFLDRKTAQLDQAVAIKEKQIALLKERKQILIQNAVTRGLNPDAPMRDSGVEWIGKIPAHWAEKRLKNCIAKIIDNRGRTPEFGDEGIPMLEVKNITDGDNYPTENFEKYVLPHIVKKYERDKVKVGDLLISTVGATSGKVVIINKNPKYFICQNVVGMRVNSTVISEFASFALSSLYFKTSLYMINKGNTIDNLKVSIFVNNIILIPPIEEQTAIVDHIETESAKIDQAISIQQQQIGKLKEYKATLINSAVTGKIKVA